MMNEQEMGVVSRHISRCRKAIQELQSGVYSDDFRDAWDTFLTEFGKAMSKTIDLSIRHPATRENGHRLKKAHAKDDYGLVYLRVARNMESHTLTPPARYRDANFSVKGFLNFGIAKGTAGEVTFDDCWVEDPDGVRHIDHAHVKFEAGQRPVISGAPPEDLWFQNGSVDLEAVTAEDRKTYGKPTFLMGTPLDAGTPDELALAAMSYLETYLVELKKVFPNL